MLQAWSHSVDDCRRHVLFITTSSKVLLSKERVSVVVAYVWMQHLKDAEDCQIARLQVRSAVRRDEAQHDVTESGLHSGQVGLTDVDVDHVPEKDPRLSFFTQIQYIVQTGRELQDHGRRCPL